VAELIELQALPQVGRVHHFGYVVHDLGRSVSFYSRLGGIVLADTVFEGPDFDRAVGLGDVSMRIAMMSFGTTLVELIQYTSPSPEAPTLRNCDVGSAHLALEVSDIASVARDLAAEGVAFYSEPIPILEGPVAGGFFCYCRDPDGRSIELLQLPASPTG
jgi:catechol 2,3-dioxygenase-like lactoylglutathione lyase family enzyme